MGVVALKKSGLIYRDSFSASALDERWELSPNDLARYELLGDALRLKPGADPLFLFFPLLTTTSEFVIDVKNVYNPTAGGNLGGITVFGTETDRLDMEEYYDAAEGVTKAYPWIRVARSFNSYSAYWSESGSSWVFEGADNFDVESPKVGVYLTGSESMDVEEVRIFRSTKVKVTGLIEGSKVELVGGGATASSAICRAGMTEVSLDVSGISLPFTGSFVITLPDGNSFSSTDTYEVWGGDEYNFELNVDLYLVEEDGTELLLVENMEKFLGYISAANQGYKDFRIMARNNLATGTIKDIKISLAWDATIPASEKLADLYQDANGAPAVKYDVLNFPTIVKGGAVPFWVRVYRITEEMAAVGMSDIYFGMNVSSTFINIS